MKEKFANKPVFFSVAVALLTYIAYRVFLLIFSAEYGSVNIFGWGIYSGGDLRAC